MLVFVVLLAQRWSGVVVGYDRAHVQIWSEQLMEMLHHRPVASAGIAALSGIPCLDASVVRM